MRNRDLIVRTCADAGRLAASTVLVASAFLKHFIPDYNSTDFFAITSPRLYAALIVAELMLGLLLLLRTFSGAEAYVAFVAFLGFGAVQLYHVITGEKTCGCLGTLSVPPSFMLAIDLTLALLLLLYARTSPWPASRWSRSLAPALIVIILGYVTLELTMFRGPEAVSAFFSGRERYAMPQHVDFGILQPGETGRAIVTIHNASQQSVTLVGASQLPFVYVGEDLPMTIGPGTNASFRISLVARGKEGRHVRRIVVYCTDDRQLTGVDAYLSWTITDRD